MTSPSWEIGRFAASREKCFRTENTRQKHGYIISSYEPLADLFFLYFNIRPNNNKTKIGLHLTKKKKKKKKKKKCCMNFFFKTFNLFYTDFIGSKLRRVLKKIPKRIIFISFDISQAS